MRWLWSVVCLDHCRVVYKSSALPWWRALRETSSRVANIVKSQGRRTREAGSAAVIQGAMSEYLLAQREFARVAEACSNKGWPDRRALLYYTWHCQTLYIRRQEMRFERLLALGEFETGDWNSLGIITDRLYKTWTDSDEASALASDPVYQELTTEIARAEKARASMDQELLEGPLRTVQNQTEYRVAREAIADKVHELDQWLARLLRR